MLLVPDKPFQPDVMIVAKGWYLPEKRAPTWWLSLIGSSLNCKHYTRLERLARAEYSCLLVSLSVLKKKVFYNIFTWSPWRLAQVLAKAERNCRFELT